MNYYKNQQSTLTQNPKVIKAKFSDDNNLLISRRVENEKQCRTREGSKAKQTNNLNWD